MGRVVGVPDVTCGRQLNGYHCDRPAYHQGLHRDGRWRWDDESTYAEQSYRDPYPYDSKEKRCNSRYDGHQCVMREGHRCQHGNGRLMWRTDPTTVMRKSGLSSHTGFRDVRITRLDSYGKPSFTCSEYPAGLHGDSRFLCINPAGHFGPHKTASKVYTWTNDDGYLREIAAGRLPPNRRCAMSDPRDGGVCELILHHGGPHIRGAAVWRDGERSRRPLGGEWKTIEITLAWAPDDNVRELRDHLHLDGMEFTYHIEDHDITVKIHGYEDDLKRWRESMLARRKHVAKLAHDG